MSELNAGQTRFGDRIPRGLLAFLAGVAPALVTLALVGGYLKRSLFDFRPAIWNDQAYYWHQILTFSHARFNGGYYMFYERLPVFDFFHFGASGFLYPALYGTLGRVVGWETYTGVLLNMLGIALGIWIVIYVARLDRVQIVLLGLFTLAVAPVLQMMPTNMQESFHQTAAFILAAFFYRLLGRDANTPLPRWFVPAGVAFLVVISLLRFSWALLFLPLLLLSLNRWTWRRVLGAVVVSGLLAVAVLLIFQDTSAPGNNSIFKRVGVLSSSPLAGIELIVNAIRLNLENMLRIDDIHHPELARIEYIQFFVLALCLLFAGRSFLKPVNQPGITFSRWREWGFHLYNLTTIFGAALVFYLSNGYFRVFAPHILLSGVLLIAFKNYRLVIVLVVIGLFGIIPFLTEYQPFSANFIPIKPEQLAQTKAPYAQFLIYEPDADPWCNTLLTQAEFLDNRITFVPAGIGISFFVAPSDQPLPIRSRYLLLDPLSYEVLHTRVNLEYLADVQSGRLYRNRDVNCGT